MIGINNFINFSMSANELLKLYFGIDMFYLTEVTLLDFSTIDEYEIIKNLFNYFLKFVGYI